MTSTVSRSRTRSRWQDLAIALALLACTVAVQMRNSAYSSEYARHFDEPAQFVTGLAVRDFIESGDWSDPLGFAERFYLHYPKVAMGHWPPVFYLMQAIWMFVAGVSRTSSMILMALVMVALLVLVVRSLRVELGAWLAVSSGLALLLLPQVQFAVSLMMAELPLALFALAATVSFGVFLAKGNRGSALSFSFFAVVAIMTKPNGLALALVPPLALLFSWRWGALRNPWFWLPALIVGMVCAPWYWLTLDMMANGPFSSGISMASVAHKAAAYSLSFSRLLGPGLLVLCGVGFVDRVLVPRGGQAFWSALGALMIGAVAYHWFVPADLPQRHILFSLPPAICFAAAGAERLARLLASERARVTVATLLLLVGVVGAWLLDRVTVPVPSARGFGPVAQSIVSEEGFGESVLMVVSDPIGEGAFVAEVAKREERPGHIVLRASKVLSRSNWNGSQFELIYATVDDLWTFVCEVPVGVILVDRSVTEPFLTRDQLLVREMIDLHRDRFTLVGSFPLVRDGLEFERDLELYSLNGHQGKDVIPIEIDMEAMLGKTLTVVPTP